MTMACFKSKSFSAGKMSGSLREHNERDFNEQHKRPGYILDAKHLHKKGNQSKIFLSVDDVKKEYLETTKWGRTHGKFHHSANPFREAIITFEDHHTIDDFEKLKLKLEDELDIQTMYMYLHRDEGYLNENGAPIYNFHCHFGFTNLKNGKLNHFDNVKCQKAQDICAEVLQMKRGKKGSDANALDHREFRLKVRAEDQLQSSINKAKKDNYLLISALNQSEEENTELKTENNKLRAEMIRLNKQSPGVVTQSDYQELKKLRDNEQIEHKQKLEEMNELVDELREKAINQFETDELIDALHERDLNQSQKNRLRAISEKVIETLQQATDNLKQALEKIAKPSAKRRR